MSLRIIIISGVMTLLLNGCGTRNQDMHGSVDPGVVTNPKTADGNERLDLLPEITFKATEHDFGRIIEGENVSFNFSFINTGKRDLVLADVSSSCGCTVASYPKTAIRPGEAGIIKVTFNSQGRKGFQAKSVVVVANTQPNVVQLKIKAQVIAPGAE